MNINMKALLIGISLTIASTLMNNNPANAG